MTKFQKRLKPFFDNYKWFRKWCGGYWERWNFNVSVGPIWINVTKEQAYNPKYRPGAGMGTALCEYYPINFFDSKMYFDDETKIQLERQSKLNRILK
jgi:hypothetical protein